MKYTPITIEVEAPKKCKNPRHWDNMIIFGACDTCKREWALDKKPV